MDLKLDLTRQELARWLHLRALEWANWPVYLSLTTVPILLIFCRWYYVLGAVVFSDLLWVLIRYAIVSPTLSLVGSALVENLKWPIAIGSSIYLFVKGHHVIAFLALAWPLLGGLICVPGQVGIIELALAEKVDGGLNGGNSPSKRQ
jgi:hypothetical protein